MTTLGMQHTCERERHLFGRCKVHHDWRRRADAGRRGHVPGVAPRGGDGDGVPARGCDSHPSMFTPAACRLADGEATRTLRARSTLLGNIASPRDDGSMSTRSEFIMLRRVAISTFLVLTGAGADDAVGAGGGC